MSLNKEIIDVRKELCGSCEYAKQPAAAHNADAPYGVISGSFCAKSKMPLPKALKKEAYECPIGKFISPTIDNWRIGDPKISIITCIFNVQKYIEHFMEDITRQTIFESNCELILINADSPQNEYKIIKKYLEKYNNIIYKRLDKDPGLYECWNIAIKMAKGKYITNANPDDSKAINSLEKHMNELEENPEIDVVCSPVKITKTPNKKFEECTDSPIWFGNRKAHFSTKELLIDNLPHNSPMWRKKIHNKMGFFSEREHGPLADWEFWLRCSVHSVNFRLLNKPLNLYLIEPESHNRRFKNKEQKKKEIRDKYTYHPNYKFTSNEPIKYTPKLQFNPDLLRHTHRSGWSYAIDGLRQLYIHGGILLDDFVDLNFVHKKRGGPPYKQPWVGFMHNPPNMPSWFHEELSPKKIMKTKNWKKSMAYCKGLFCFSKYHRDWLQKNVNVPVNMLYHPTETPQNKFDLNKYLEGKQQIIQIGWWLRRLSSIYLLPTKNTEKVLLQSRTDGLVEQSIRKEKRKLRIPDSAFNDNEVTFINHVPNELYDELLSKNIVFMHLWDSSANNAIIECIVRNTPVLVNRLPAVEEYLGKQYPFYFENLEEAAEKAEDKKLVEKTHKYLIHHPIKEKLKRIYFVHDFVMSDIYQNLPEPSSIKL